LKKRPRESDLNFRDDVDDNVIDLTETTSKSFLLGVSWRSSRAPLWNAVASSQHLSLINWIGSMLMSNTTTDAVLNNVGIAETTATATATPGKIAVVITEQRFPTPDVLLGPVYQCQHSKRKSPNLGSGVVKSPSSDGTSRMLLRQRPATRFYGESKEGQVGWLPHRHSLFGLE
jgi:hypothetical protein